MILIKNGLVKTMAGEDIENGQVLLDGDKIAAVGKEVNAPADAQVIDAAGCIVAPGFVEGHCHIGLDEEAIGFEGDDYNEMTDPVTPQMRGIDGLNPMDEAFFDAYSHGVTTAVTGPGSANVVGGTFLAVKLCGKRVDNMVVKNPVAMKIAFGENPKRCYGASQKKMPMTRMGTAALLRQTFYDAKNYSDALLKAEKDPSKAPKPDFKLDALVPVMRREMKCRIHAHRADDICTAIRICKEFDLDFSIEHATEGYKITDVLQKNDVTCVVGPHLWGPGKQEIHGLSLHTPAALHEAGITVCLTADSGSQTQFLPATVGILMVNGLDEQAAFEGVTINPARLLGVADKVGSIEVGKDADLAVFSGHPFSSLSKCMMTMIDGVAYNKSL